MTSMTLRTVPITLRPNSLLETGRASYQDVIQQLPTKGGIRECLIARAGTVLCSVDYTGLELTTHAQSCLNLLGWSKMAEALNSGRKVHDALASRIMGISYEEFQKRYNAGGKLETAIRKGAKAGNFGFPGGMGVIKFVLSQRASGPDTTSVSGVKYRGLRFCILVGEENCGKVKLREYKRKPVAPVCSRCVEVVEQIRASWFVEFPENIEMFKLISDWSENGMLVDGKRLQPGQIQQHYNKRIRGGTDFCSAANGFFQSLAARGAKLALTRVSRECYDRTFRLPNGGGKSPLFGCRPILFAHDEIISELPRPIMHEAAYRQAEVQIEAMREVVPDVLIEAEPALMTRLLKEAAPAFVTPINTLRKGKKQPGDRLIPWDEQYMYPEESSGS